MAASGAFFKVFGEGQDVAFAATTSTKASGVSLDRTRLGRVLAMIGSSFDGEALAAARRANEMIKAAGLTWEQALGNHETEIATEACHRLLAERDELLEEITRLKGGTSWASVGWVDPRSDAEKVDRCLEYAEYLTEWEQDFIDNLAGWSGHLTPKQSRRLDELVAKVRRLARAREQAA